MWDSITGMFKTNGSGLANSNYQSDYLSRKLLTDKGTSENQVVDSNNTGYIPGTEFTMGGFLGGVDALAKLGNVGVGLANYGLAKDAYKFNVMNANRNYEADKTKYNNALARTEAVNAVYGSPNVATKL